MDSKVGLVPVVEFAGYIGRFTRFNFAFLPSERIPDTGRPAIPVNGPFNLVGGCSGSPDKIGAKIGTTKKRGMRW